MPNWNECAVADLHRHFRCLSPPPIFFIFMQFSEIMGWPNFRLLPLVGLLPPWGDRGSAPGVLRSFVFQKCVPGNLSTRQ